MNPIVEKVYQIGIIPVIAFNSVDEARPCARLWLRAVCPQLRSPSAPLVLRSASARSTRNARDAAGRRHCPDLRAG